MFGEAVGVCISLGHLVVRRSDFCEYIRVHPNGRRMCVIPTENGTQIRNCP